MAASYPSSVKSFPVITAGDTVQPIDESQGYDEITAVEQGLLNGLAHDLKFTDATYDIGKSGATRPRDGFFSRNLTVGGTLAVTGAITAAPFGAGTVGTVGVGVGDTDVGLYSSGTNALDVATNGVKALGIDATQFIDSPTQPRCVAFHSGTQAVTAGNTSALTLDSEDLDVGTMHDTVTNNNRVTIPTGADGLYLVQGQSYADNGGNTTFTMALHIRKNGTIVATGQMAGTANINVGKATLAAGGLFVLAAGDYVELAGTAVTNNITFGSATAALASRLSVVKLW